MLCFMHECGQYLGEQNHRFKAEFLPEYKTTRFTKHDTVKQISKLIAGYHNFTEINVTKVTVGKNAYLGKIRVFTAK